MSAPNELLEQVFQSTDAEVSRAIETDKLHRGTALFVMNCFAEEARKNVVGLELVATHTEAAVKPQVDYGG